MKKILLILLALLLLAPPAFAYTVPDETIVYITPTGEKYHREDCTYTGSDARSMTIKTAERKGYTPCSRCDPDDRTGKYVSHWDGVPGGSRSDNSTVDSRATANASISSLPYFVQFILGIIIPVAIVALTLLPFWLHKAIKKRKDRRDRELRYMQEKEKYTKLYAGKAPKELVNMPVCVEMGPDDLPKVIGHDGWSSAFTFYVTANGRAYHRTCGCSGARLPEHAVNCVWRPPCLVCHPKLPDLSWYVEYRKIKAIKDKYNID